MTVSDSDSPILPYTWIKKCLFNLDWVFNLNWIDFKISEYICKMMYFKYQSKLKNRFFKNYKWW